MTSSPGQAAACALYEQQRRPLFPLGQVLITPGALDMLESLELAPLPFVLRHVAGDWGELCPRWPLQIPPPVATPNSPRQDRSDYDDSGLMAMRAAASLRR